jgi:electron transfer flavoprotein alpha subunit
VAAAVSKFNFTHVLAPSDSRGKNFLPRAAALLDVNALADITSVVSEDTFVRPIYAGNALATVQSLDKVWKHLATGSFSLPHFSLLRSSC